MILASEWRSLVRIPHWEPVREIALYPRSAMAMESRDEVLLSPAVRSMSISRLGGFDATSTAMARRSLVVFPMAETTTTMSSPASLQAQTCFATLRIMSIFATEEPPYFWTMTDITIREATTPFLKCRGVRIHAI